MVDLTPLDDEKLRRWAESRAIYGTATTKRIAKGVLRVLEERDTLRVEVRRSNRAAMNA